jgi:alanyl-tRNA synthetase
MTKRLYYDDAYTTRFSAQIIERLRVGDQPAVILDQTYFYPASGGQPADQGRMNGVAVMDVFLREGDGAVVHLLAGDMEGDRVDCQIDWARRFDHMQHHSGQHILSQAFVQVAQARTIGFHLSADSVTIDLDKPSLPPAVVEQVEELANQIVYENRPVRARFLAAGEETQIEIRKLPDHLPERLRIVEVEGFDATACGGTHVSRTGEIGLIKVLKAERRGEETRIEFRCGWRALRDYRAKNALANQLAADLTVGYWEVGEAVTRLRADLKATRQALNAAQERLLDEEASRLLQTADRRGEIVVVRAAFDGREAGELRALASRLIQPPGVLALVGTSGSKAHLIMARSADLPYDMAAVLKQALMMLGSARGGGRADFAQGGGVSASLEQVESALVYAEQTLFQS